MQQVDDDQLNKDIEVNEQKNQEQVEEEVVDEDEVIDVAERVFFRIADQLTKQGQASMRALFKEHIFETEVQGQMLELLTPDGLLDGIKALGITDLTEKDSRYLLRVLTKPELEGTIVVQELLQIMENLGFKEEYENNDESSSEEDEVD